MTKHHLLCIGVDQWTVDATTFKRHFVDDMHFLRDNIYLLNEGDGPTADDVLAEMERMRTSGRVGPKDLLVFYYSGHGSLDENKIFHFGTRSKKLSCEDLFKAISLLGPKRVLYIIDACEAAGVSAIQILKDACLQTNPRIETAILAASLAGQKAPGNSAFTHMFVTACESAKAKQRRLEQPTEMCLYPGLLQHEMNTSREGLFADAPKAFFSGVSFPFGPLYGV